MHGGVAPAFAETDPLSGDGRDIVLSERAKRPIRWHPYAGSVGVISEPTWVIKCVVKLRSTSRIDTIRQGAPRRERSRSPSSSLPPRAAGGGQRPAPPRRHRRTHRDARRLCVTRHSV